MIVHGLGFYIKVYLFDHITHTRDIDEHWVTRLAGIIRKTKIVPGYQLIECPFLSLFSARLVSLAGARYCRRTRPVNVVISQATY